MSAAAVTPLEAVILGVYAPTTTASSSSASASSGTAASASASVPTLAIALRKDMAPATASVPALTSQLVATLADGVARGRWGVTGKPNQVRIVHDLGDGPAALIAFVGLGKQCRGPELSCEAKERVRMAVSAATRALRDMDVKKVYVDDVHFAHGAAEGAHLGAYEYKKHGHAAKQHKEISILPLIKSAEFSTGEHYATAQNLSRFLTELPANLATPTILAEKVREEFAGRKNVTVNVHDEAWIREKKMGSMLSVNRGSAEEPRFVEIIYKGTGKGEKPIALVGKGVTFDSGGISIKPSSMMHLMKGDMGGAATVIAALSAITRMEVPIDIVGIIPFVENMPDGKATKPGDVVIAGNGMSIEVINTDAEGRLILADALHHACTTYDPKTVIDFATLTGAVMIALGPPFAGVWSTTDRLWSDLEAAGRETGDPFWRLPFHRHYRKAVTTSNVADLVNSTASRYGGACNAAAFLSHFVKGVVPEDEDDINLDKIPHYAHIDIAGVAEEGHNKGYQPEGMTGRPTRTVIEYLRRLAQKK